MAESRIPLITGSSRKAVFTWLTALHKGGLLFCLDDKPEDIVSVSNGSLTFSDDEAKEVSKILSRLFEKLGDELHCLAFDVVSKTFHTCAEQRACKTMYG